MTLPRSYYLFRYHRLRQLAMRLIKIMRMRRLRRKGAADYATPDGAPHVLRECSAFSNLLQWKLDERRQRSARIKTREIINGNFNFLGQALNFPANIDWRMKNHPEFDALWCFHLHYQEYLLDLVAAQIPRSNAAKEHAHLTKSWQIVGDWIQRNQPHDGNVFKDAWHPFCISRRLPVWMLLWAAGPPEESNQATILKSMVSQANFLADHLEFDLGGNHLLENLRALGMASCFISGSNAERWMAIVNQRLPNELNQQITQHGEHFERSPMYHGFMLEAVLDLRDVMQGVDTKLSRLCGDSAIAMANFLRKILHPDNELPLLSDTAFDQCPPSQTLLKRAGIASVESCQPAATKSQADNFGGYWTFRDNKHFLIYDAGPACADHLPAHAHADLLTLEVSLGGQRVIVDSGVYGYADDSMRQYCRSTAAHNVLQVDQTEQFDMWSRFRVGYRGWPQPIQTGQTENFSWARASHNAYRRCGVPVVGRWLACRTDGPWIGIDWANGQGEHQMVQHFHLNPELNISQLDDRSFRLEIESQCFQFQVVDPSIATLEEGWYCPRFGTRLRAPVIKIQSQLQLPHAMGWVLTWPDQSGMATLNNPTDTAVKLTWEDEQGCTQFQPCNGM